MNTLGVIGIIASVLTLAGAILMHLFKTAWWMSNLSTVLTLLRESVEKIEKRMADYENKHLTREDGYRELGKLDLKVDALHKRVDEFLGQK